MNCGGVYLTADFLYWRSENHGFSYAYSLEATTPSGLNVGNMVRPDPKWAPAFRAGLGWNTAYDFWDVLLNYTWYGNHTSKTRSNALGFIPVWPASSSDTARFEQVTGRSRFILNMGDLEIGRMVYLTKSIAIRPHLGARGGTLHQKFSNLFTVGLAGDNREDAFNAYNRYWGVGPRTGVNGEWHMSRAFSLLGKAAGALLYGETKAQGTHEVMAANESVFAIERQYSDSFYQLVPQLQLSLGVQWQTCFWCEKMFFKMSASWESNVWWDQFNVPFGVEGSSGPLPTVGNQPLTMEGLTVNLEWDF